MSFRDKTWQQRIDDTEMFYWSERLFEEKWPGPWERYGLGEKSNDMAVYKMPPFILHTPDYRAALNGTAPPVLVEVQGCGGVDSTHKFKQKKLDVLAKWNSIHEVTFWLWSNADETYVWTSYGSIRLAIAQGKAVHGQYDGHRDYWALPVDLVEQIADTDRLMSKYG